MNEKSFFDKINAFNNVKEIDISKYDNIENYDKISDIKYHNTNYGNLWTYKEDIELLEDIKNNVDIQFIAFRHKRTIGSIKARCVMHALYELHKNNYDFDDKDNREILTNISKKYQITIYELKKKFDDIDNIIKYFEQNKIYKTNTSLKDSNSIIKEDEDINILENKINNNIQNTFNNYFIIIQNSHFLTKFEPQDIKYLKLNKDKIIDNKYNYEESDYFKDFTENDGKYIKLRPENIKYNNYKYEETNNHFLYVVYFLDYIKNGITSKLYISEDKNSYIKYNFFKKNITIINQNSIFYLNNTESEDLLNILKLYIDYYIQKYILISKENQKVDNIEDIKEELVCKKENRLITISDLSKFNIDVSLNDQSGTHKIPRIDYFVYTDGACINNGSENAIAGIGIYFGEDDIRNVSKKVIGKQSNNTAELQAIINVYDIIKDDLVNKKICIVSDSTYALRCITDYGEEQYKSNWKKNIPNKDLVKYGYELYKNETNIYFMYIKAHTENIDIHSKGNDGADKLANKAIGLEECPYNIVTKETSNKIYINVPFTKKEEIKKLGGKWDQEKKKWYIFNDNIYKNDILDKFN